MKRIILALPLILLSATPARATGGMVCSTAGALPAHVSLTLGHVVGSPLVGAHLTDLGRPVPVKQAQWWLDRSELRLLLVDPQALREEARIKAIRKGSVYDGTIWRNGARRWIRCREG